MTGELAQLVARPRHHGAHDADDERRSGGHQAGVGSEVGRDLDAIAARTNADARRSTVRGEQHHGHREHVREQIGQPFDGAAVRRLTWRKVERHVVVRAEPDEAHGLPTSRLPRIELGAQEGEALPEGSRAARSAPAIDLDHRRRELDDTGIEVHGTAGGQVVRAAGPMHQWSPHDVARRAEYLFGSREHPIDDRRELGLETDRGETSRLPGLLRASPRIAPPRLLLPCAATRRTPPLSTPSSAAKERPSPSSTRRLTTDHRRA